MLKYLIVQILGQNKIEIRNSPLILKLFFEYFYSDNEIFNIGQGTKGRVFFILKIF